ncbi:MAG TPA: ABC transporter permease [Thermoplasmata archaeon]|nr:ABC transporter permease [Thermoplasmata archaeon]
MDHVIDEKVLAEMREGRVFPAFALIGWRWVARNPVATIVPILLPFFFLYFLALVTPPNFNLFPLQVVGAMLFTTQNIGSWCLSDSAYWRLEQRLQDMFVASPLDKFRYLFGVAFSNLIPAAPALIILGVVLALVTPVSLFGWLVLAAAIFMVWVLYSAIGIAVSSRLQSQMEVWPVGTLVFTTLGILSPLYYPLAFLSAVSPAWAGLARFLPATYAALIVQSALGLPQAMPSEATLDAVLLLVSTIVGLVIAMRLYTWRER